MSAVNKALVQMLAEIRQKNLFVFVVMPTFFDLDKYVALWRSRALIHIYTSDTFERGYFAFYNVDKKKSLYVNGKKFYNYRCEKPNFYGRFTQFFPLDITAYKKKKLQSLESKEDIDDEDDAEEQERLKEFMFRKMALLPGITNEMKSKAIGISEVTFYTKIKKYKKELEELKQESEEAFKANLEKEVK